MAPGSYRFNLKSVIFKLKTRIDIFSITFHEIAIRLMPQNLADD